MNKQQYNSNVLIIGSGAAGLSLALHLADEHTVTVLAKGALSEGCTYHAQGGIAAVLDDNDSFRTHIEDTLTAGAGLCDPAIVRYAIEKGPEAIQWLVEQGVDFTTDNNTHASSHWHLTQEGGHSHRRVVHSADATGKSTETSLLKRASEHKNITLHDHQISIDLITSNETGLSKPRCTGAYVLNQQSGEINVYAAPFVVLATGGASKVYLYTSNPDLSTGDGIAMGWRAGCRIANMEFNQFHPTCLYHPEAKSYLITEAIRGEGGHLLLPDGTRFMSRFDARRELAPRDIVARAIDHEMKRLGADCVYLDISHKSAEFITSHFPTVYANCKAFGIDITREPIPIVPAAHYTCGGVVTDKYGKTDIPGLYAIGETAYTGLHGANRLASNSLLECLVFAQSAADDIRQNMPDAPGIPAIPEWDESRVTDSDEEVVVSHNWDEVRRFMWDYVGIVRTDKRLQRAQRRAKLLSNEIAEYYSNFRVSNDLIELRNLVQVAELIIQCAIERKESRGL
ncbi:L-aspartate oxidase, partial [Candidatus Pacearchaeota archaeon]|nr:L-aspartate oxidase [Candidatus Pacearchaeota archaeon]